jgi:hypothetical protein
MSQEQAAHGGQIGAAGVQFAAAQMLLNKITPCFPIWDGGYDLVSEFQGVIKRVQVKATATIEKRRSHLSALRFSLYRRKPNATTNVGNFYRKKKVYTHGQFDAMVFVNFPRNKLFVVPASHINFSRAHIYLSPDSPWLNAWWVLTDLQPSRSASRRRA